MPATLIRLAVCLLLLGARTGAVCGEPTDEAPKVITLPGLTVNMAERFVDVAATVCLTKGYLELIACTRETKEHESIVAIEALPQHVHAALLLLGVQNGHPATQQQVSVEPERWAHLPPRGDAIRVALVVKDERGNPVERPISDFVSYAAEDASSAPAAAPPDGRAAPPPKLPDEFLFAGSIIEGPQDNRVYLAQRSGNVVSVSTFGDEVLCLPGHHSSENGALVWRANPDTLPARGTGVTLRLRPVERRPALLPTAPRP